MKNKFVNRLIISILLIGLFSCTPDSQNYILETQTSTQAVSKEHLLTQTKTPLPSQTVTPTQTSTSTNSATPTNTPIPILAGPYDYPEGVNPLTGLSVEDPMLLERQPIAVKINNYPRGSRPQWGLSQADIVFEYYHNNWLPRFHAIFYGENAVEVGPIRSGRLFDQYLMESYSSILAFAGADYRILKVLKETDPQNLVFKVEQPCPPDPFCRYDPDGANYLIGSTIGIQDWAEGKGLEIKKPSLAGMMFSDKVQTDGLPGSSLVVRYSVSAYTNWRYDPLTGNYRRYQDTIEAYTIEDELFELLTDRTTDQPIQAENVVVLFIPHSRPYYKAATDADPTSEIVEIEMTGFGKAIMFRDGMAYRLQWIRREDDKIFHLVDLDGNDFPYKPGKTWYEVVSDVSLESRVEENWRFDFKFPLGN